MGGNRVSAGNGLIVLLPPETGVAPLWWKLVDGHIVSRSEGAARVGSEAGGPDGPAMIAVPPGVATIRRIELDPAMPAAQARAVAIRRALEMAMTDADNLYAVALERPEGAEEGVHHVALIARSDLAHIIAWGRHHGIDADIILPIGALLPEPEEGFIRADIGDMALIRGQGVVAQADEPWVQAMLAGASFEIWPEEKAEAALVRALSHPPVNLRSGAFARTRKSGVDASFWKRLALGLGLVLLASLLISVVLIVKYEWSAARLDAGTVEMAKPLLPSTTDAQAVAGEIDHMLADKGAGAYVFTGPLAGLMTAMQPVPGVSLNTLSLNEDGLLHATLASARAEDINSVLLAVQGAGYRITATSSTDPGGRVVAEITVKP